jgi:hypothetical protein
MMHKTIARAAVFEGAIVGDHVCFFLVNAAKGILSTGKRCCVGNYVPVIGALKLLSTKQLL